MVKLIKEGVIYDERNIEKYFKLVRNKSKLC